MNFLRNVHFKSQLLKCDKAIGVKTILCHKTNSLINKQFSVNKVNVKYNLSTFSKNHFHNTFSKSINDIKSNYPIKNRLHMLKESSINSQQHRYFTQPPNYNFNTNNYDQQQQQDYYHNEDEYYQDPKLVIAELIIHYIKSLIFIYFIHDCIFEISTVS